MGGGAPFFVDILCCMTHSGKENFVYLPEGWGFMGIGLIGALLAALLCTGYTHPPEIRDLQEISQDHLFFAKQQEKAFARLDPDLQKRADAFHNKMFFSPWHQSNSRFTLEEIEWEFDKYGKNPGYGRNGKKHPQSWIKKLNANARLQDYPAVGYPAITIQNTDLRVLPTAEAHLSLPVNCPLPFDNMQNSGAAAGTPLYVSQVTKDKKWALVETHYALGWIPVRHMARVDGDFIKLWESAPYASIIRDKTPVYDDKGKLLFKTPLGSFFPKISEDSQTITILIAAADSQGQALPQKIVLAREAAVNKPLPLTPTNMAWLAKEMMGEPYGWGGLDRKRDCSSLLMDLFAPFGIWLPRNSGHQAKRTGRYVDLSTLSPREKEKAILTQGLPYFTLLWLKGHIMLYIGEQAGRAVVFHNFWKVKTVDLQGRKGRRIVGRAVITTLNPGQELRPEGDPGEILPAIQGMTILWPPPTSVNFPPSGK